MEANGHNSVSLPGRLIYENGNGATTFLLTTARMTAGSAESNDMVIKRPKVSRIHAHFDFDGRQWTVTDQDSVAGTLVNEQPVQMAGLVDGDQIRMGAATLRFELAAASALDQTGNGNGTVEQDAEPETMDADEQETTAEEAAPSSEDQRVDVRNEPGKDFEGSIEEPIPALVEVQPTGSRRPFFLVAAGYSDVKHYANLAARLGEDQPLYVLQAPRLAAIAQPTEAIEFLAAHYIEVMREVQEDGPYQVGGYNIGGIVAYEVAQQILCVGDQVSALILIDTPYPMGNPLPSLGYRNAQAFNQLNQQFLAPLAGLGASSIGQQMAAPLRGLGKRLDAIRTSQMKRLDGDYAAFVASLSDRGFETNLTLTQSYRPSPYPGRAVLIQAEDSPVRYARMLWDWSGKARNGLDSRIIAGSYASILHDPDVAGLATQVASCLVV